MTRPGPQGRGGANAGCLVLRRLRDRLALVPAQRLNGQPRVPQVRLGQQWPGFLAGMEGRTEQAPATRSDRAASPAVNYMR